MGNEERKKEEKLRRQRDEEDYSKLAAFSDNLKKTWSQKL